MDHDELISRFPRVFHITEAGATASIARHGLLSTSALLDLFEVPEPRRAELEAQPRPAEVVLDHARHGRAVIRDNRPLRRHILERCLEPGCTVGDWCRLLNARVFLWATEKRLRTHLACRGHRDQPREVLVIDTKRLLAEHGERVTLCRFNSGSTLYPNAPRRGPDSFLAVGDYPFKDVAEVCILNGLPNALDLISRPQPRGRSAIASATGIPSK